MSEGDSINASRRRKRSRRRVRRLPLHVFFDRGAISAYVVVAAIIALIWRANNTPSLLYQIPVQQDQSIAVLDDFHLQKSLNDLRIELQTAAAGTEDRKVDPLQVKLLEIKSQQTLNLMEERAKRRNLSIPQVR
jgi:hypothetical protein